MRLKLIFISTFLLSIFSCSVNKNTIPFHWEKFELDGKQYKYGAIYIPLRILNVESQFEMQFDLGMNVNIIYERPLKTILNQYPKLKHDYFERKNYEIFFTKLKLDHYSSSIDSLFVYKNYGSTENIKKLNKIGTIGLNEVKNKILIIDYPHQTLQFFNKPEKVKNNEFTFIPIKLVKNKNKFNC